MRKNKMKHVMCDSGSMLKVWKSYVAMEIGLGNYPEARTIYKRCYNRRLDGNGSEVRVYWIKIQIYNSNGSCNGCMIQIDLRLFVRHGCVLRENTVL
jgi:hypothetical protein